MNLIYTISTSGVALKPDNDKKQHDSLNTDVLSCCNSTRVRVHTPCSISTHLQIINKSSNSKEC